MRFFFCCLLLYLAGCTPNQKRASPAPPFALPVVSTDTTPAVPLSVQAYISRHFPDWRIPYREDYAVAFWSFYDQGQLPFITATDINDDGTVDYGIFLKQAGALQLVLLLGAGDGFYHQVMPSFQSSFRDAANNLAYCLQPEAPGQIDVAYPTIQSLLLATNGINLLHFENRICLYYWDGQRIARFDTK